MFADRCGILKSGDRAGEKKMRFLRNAWYVVGWGESLSTGPMRIKVLNEAVAVYRLSSGKAVALSDRCPHRSASLGNGKVVGDTLQCPYHGLRFNESGAREYTARSAANAAETLVFPRLRKNRTHEKPRERRSDGTRHLRYPCRASLPRSTECWTQLIETGSSLVN